MNIQMLYSLYTDAEKEFRDNPDFFIEMYYDPRRNINSLLTSSKFIVLGRKGTGKTAMKQKLIIDAQSDQSLAIDLSINISDFDYFLAQKDVDESFLAKAWQLFILSYAYRCLIEAKVVSKYSLDPSIKEMMFLSKKNLLKKIVDRMTLNVSFKSKHIDVESSLTSDKNDDKININEVIDQIVKLIQNKRKPNKLYITIDSLDYFLEPSKAISKKYILSLIIAVSNLNERLSIGPLFLKTILFIRDEMFSELVFQDKNKLKMDCTIELKWNTSRNPEESDIFQMLYMRFYCSGYRDGIKKLAIELNDYFMLTGYDFYDRFLNISLGRPRDILQYLKFCQIIGDSKVQLTGDDIIKIDHNFSDIYFIGEVKDELTGHFDDVIIQDLQTILYKLPFDRFSYNTWREVILRHNVDFNDNLALSLLQKMYEFGFVGLINLSHDLDYIAKRETETPIFSYEKNYIKFPTKTGLSTCNFCLHRGIKKGLYEK
ncbi:MAG: hypothetical protein RR639_08135 [Hydrogenoanaerobacterium sp.]